MNKKQWIVLLVCAMLLLLSELFPPWMYEDENTSARRSAGYHFMTVTPKLKSPGEMRRIFALSEQEPTRFMWVRQDQVRLYGQRIIVLFGTLGLLLVLYDPRPKLNLVFGSFSLFIALGFISLYIFHISILW